ncbi:class I SAM-dependent methyltransferase [Cytophaga sp. FL35]|uniref:O-methyltransferase n=1 Tax=Cytophaga sp. FL35 TaxID=1904456 RepID=UPI00165346D4|nr:class I SAM-dependent methyltransferase [Cytophaga sp. FL35]MBC6998438.1 class I SAM-dependent methyltransferase [Cytophaga sp. FL35]
MVDSIIHNEPETYQQLLQKSEAIGFSMPSDILIGTLLKTLVASKPGGRFLELGTGMGLSLSWMLDGMDANSSLISVDNDQDLVNIVKPFFKDDKRVVLQCTDGAEWIRSYRGKEFDLIFADAWPGKYDLLDETLALLKVGGFYIIDDMDEQPNWPEGHNEKAKALVAELEKREDLVLTKMNWSTGLIIASKK